MKILLTNHHKRICGDMAVKKRVKRFPRKRDRKTK